MTKHSYRPTAKGYFSGCGGMELGIMQVGVKIQLLALDSEATRCMKLNSHYFSHDVLTADIKEKTVLSQSEKKENLFIRLPALK